MEQDIRIEARGWCGPIETDKGASENQVENIALHFYNKGYEKCQEQKRKQVEKLKKKSDEVHKEGKTSDKSWIIIKQLIDIIFKDVCKGEK